MMIASPKELTYFLEVCNTLNFSRASERLGVSQPSLSNAMKRLEQGIGVELFNRSKTGVKLTKAGTQLHAHAKQLLALWDDVKAQSLASHEAVLGQFSLGCHPSVARYSLPRFLPTLIRDYPQLEIKLVHDLSRKVLEGIINLNIDLGIIVNPIRHPDLILQKLYQDEVTFWQSSELAEIDMQQPFDLICDPELQQTQQLLKQCEQTFAEPRRIIASSNLDVIASLTASGAGIGILPKTVANSHQNLRQIPNMPFYQDEMYLTYRPELRHIKAMQVMIKHIKESF